MLLVSLGIWERSGPNQVRVPKGKAKAQQRGREGGCVPES